ncbi:GspH/FimT family pseudopilin [Gilvimarinus agarilyticus]|uniref:GspH/FimT family pseudopilin n=1 Tax=Gilvimarinus sp. 2_MG-2023 TaxID=3062666 RepID=UPI001C09B5EA|nr:GspH/FimT family pseudopilin [Gilvimarinus sp. 2_MG-2023]MBU2885211.1 GspH/FimT family pseudopilin [Gilvimarinus agarilyticus]MDO6570108.1 GspH/FimT family pseudopilin [Gilvimarinus sp. 2_MG-2023]
MNRIQPMCPENAQPHRSLGFTIIELMLTVAVVAVLIALAAPNMSTLLTNNRSEALSEELTNALQITRTEAIKRGERVSICAANAAMSACGGAWTNGWLIVTDDAVTDGAGAVVVGDIVAQFDAPHGDSRIAADNGGAVSFVRYTSTGELARIGGNNNTTPVTFTVHVDGCKGSKQRQISIGVAGMMDVNKTECPEGS